MQWSLNQAKEILSLSLISKWLEFFTTLKAALENRLVPTVSRIIVDTQLQWKSRDHSTSKTRTCKSRPIRNNFFVFRTLLCFWPRFASQSRSYKWLNWGDVSEKRRVLARFDDVMAQYWNAGWAWVHERLLIQLLSSLSLLRSWVRQSVFDRDLASLSRSYKWLILRRLCY